MEDSDPLQDTNRRQSPQIVFTIIVGVVILLAVAGVGWMLYMQDENDPTTTRELQEDYQGVIRESLPETPGGSYILS